MDFKEVFKLDWKRSIWSLGLAIFVFFFFGLWERASLWFTNHGPRYMVNTLEVQAGALPIVSYNWLGLFLGLLLSLILGYLITVLLLNTIFKNSVKKFFVFSKEKLYFGLGLTAFIVLMSLAINELNWGFLRHIYYFFNLSAYYEGTIGSWGFTWPSLLHAIFIPLISLFLFLLHVYTYACLIVYIKDCIQRKK